VDSVYADFEIEVQTNSTLPMDRQSLANLSINLFQMKAIDRTALFEMLRFPKGEEIAKRMDMAEQMAAQRTAPQPPPGAVLPLQPQGGVPGGQGV
jgi:hypothetical protein